MESKQVPQEEEVEAPQLLLLGAGLPCTGNTSLKTALEMLGFKVRDSTSLLRSSAEMEIWSSLAYEYWLQHGSDFVYRMDWTQGGAVDAIVDLPLSLFYKEISRQYPECKVIVTIRADSDEWLHSLRTTLLDFHFGVLKRLFYRLRLNPLRFVSFVLGATLSALERVSNLALFMVYHECVDFDIVCDDEVFRDLSSEDSESDDSQKPADANSDDDESDESESSVSHSDSGRGDVHDEDESTSQSGDERQSLVVSGNGKRKGKAMFGRKSEWEYTVRKRGPQLRRSARHSDVGCLPKALQWLAGCCLSSDEMDAVMNTAAVPLSDAQWLRLYDRWLADAYDFFAPARHRLLVYDVANGWPPLCRFLGVETPRVAFPHLYARKQRAAFRQLIWWLHLFADLFVVLGIIAFCYGLYLFLILINIIR